MTVANYMKEIIELEKNARKRIINELEKLKLTVKNGGIGRNTQSNDRSMYMWISVEVDGNEFLIDLFYSEIDSKTGNCHCQIGRIEFVKGLNNNSPNEVLKIYDEKTTEIKFHSYKWCDPLDYIDEKDFSKDKCDNKKWLTVDDVNNNEKVPYLLAKAFVKFIKESQC